ncbi:MAG: DUF3817 domain-containing protein [Chitinophagaceae bacterium]|nr:DUF3817 domain-containing protein [Chitinophagaceae bacterium]
MKYFSNTPVGRFRLIAVIEGISYLTLLFISMPIKYILHEPSVVTYNGWVHGILFMLYLWSLTNVAGNERWRFGKSMKAFFAAFIPFATFVLEKKLHKEEKMKLATETVE